MTATYALAHIMRRKESNSLTAFKQFYATDLAREELGKFICNKRRHVTDVKRYFPVFDFKFIHHNDDMPFEQISLENSRAETIAIKICI